MSTRFANGAISRPKALLEKITQVTDSRVKPKVKHSKA
jgi:hypothetical protein